MKGNICYSNDNKELCVIENGYVVKDDIEAGYANVIPLWAFGLLY